MIRNLISVTIQLVRTVACSAVLMECVQNGTMLIEKFQMYFIQERKDVSISICVASAIRFRVCPTTRTAAVKKMANPLIILAKNQKIV